MQAIDTVYNGYKFRSRLEARWAYFFDLIGIEYEYEPEGIMVNGMRYLPDFYLPQFHSFFEVKRRSLLDTEEGEKAIKKISYGMESGAFSGLICFGDPADDCIRIFCQEYSDSSGGNYEDNVRFSLNDDLEPVLKIFMSRSDREFIDTWGGMNSIPIEVGINDIHPIVSDAKIRARQVRFEHGEAP